MAPSSTWDGWQEFLEICACSPGSATAGIQMEALKKPVLVQLIHEGRVTPHLQCI